MNKPVAVERKRRARKSAGGESETREDILDAAAKLIVSDGYGACTMRSISEKVSIKAGSLYYHFSSKDEIVVEIMNKGAESLLEQVRGAVEALPDKACFRDRLRAAIRVHVTCKLDRSMPYMQVYEHLTPMIRRQGRVMRKRYADFWKDLIETGKASGAVAPELNTGLFVSYVLSGLNRTPEWVNETMKIDEVVDMILGVVTSGIRDRQSGVAAPV